MPYEKFVGAGADTFCVVEVLVLAELLELAELEELLLELSELEELLPLTDNFCPGYMIWEEILLMFINVL